MVRAASQIAKKEKRRTHHTTQPHTHITTPRALTRRDRHTHTCAHPFFSNSNKNRNASITNFKCLYGFFSYDLLLLFPVHLLNFIILVYFFCVSSLPISRALLLLYQICLCRLLDQGHALLLRGRQGLRLWKVGEGGGEEGRGRRGVSVCWVVYTEGRIKKEELSSDCMSFITHNLPSSLPPYLPPKHPPTSAPDSLPPHT